MNKLKKLKTNQKVAVVSLLVVLMATVLFVKNDFFTNLLTSIGAPIANNTSTRAINANPNFTIQHYFYFDDIDVVSQSKGNSYVKVINTNNGGHGTGGKLPKNGNGDSVSYIELIKNGSSDRYVPKTTRKLTQLFKDEKTDYKSNPTINYMSRLYNDTDDYNKNYTLTEVWILKDGKEATSVDANDFYVYKVPKTSDGRHNPEAINFTNNPNHPKLTKLENGAVPTADNYTILISENTVVRLVFDTMTTTDYKKTGVDFYDYDISDGYIYSSASTANKTNTSQQSSKLTGPWYANIYLQGINSNGNYGNTGSKYGFGNGLDTGRKDETWNNNGKQNRINRANNSVNPNTMAVFGLTSSYASDGSIIWATGVNGPKIFGPDVATGKTSYRNNEFSLDFTRKGGTFVLSGVTRTSDNKKVLSNLDSFIMRDFSTKTTTKWIFSNDFWPMDYANSWGSNNHDLKFGQTGAKLYYLNSTGTKQGGTLATSDDKLMHNAYFGMSYEVEFTLDPGYVAPLDFFFFGDDDFWLFLTEPNGTQKLIADIGGIHSALGEYVNLWDYITPVEYEKDGQTQAASGTYKLKFFYTERGASGSTNYMRFTVPLDSKAQASPETKNLKIEKEVVGTEEKENEDYTFKVDFKNNIEDIYDIYNYKVYDQDGTEKSSENMMSGDTLTLKKGEYLIIEGVPDTVTYTITEQTDNMTKTEYQKGTIGGSLASPSKTSSKTITDSIKTNNYVKFINSYAGISISKEVKGPLGDKNKEFTFAVTLGDTSFNGTRNDVKFTNGVGTFKLKNGETKIISGLPEGTYTVTETNNDDYTVYKTGDTGTITVDKIQEVKFVNYKTKDLRIEKDVSGDALSANEEYTFSLKLEGISDSIYPTSYTYEKYDSSNQKVTNGNGTISSASQTFSLKKGEYIVIKDLPDETEYTVTEQSEDASKITYYQGNVGTGLENVDEQESNEVKGKVSEFDYVKFVNYFDDLVVRKTVLGSGDKNKDFAFTVTLSDTSVTGTYGQMEFTNGVATFTLKHNQTKKAIGLPGDITYTVTESGNEGYKVYSTNATGKLVDGKNSTATFTNYITKTLKIEKEVVNGKDNDTEYEFTLTLVRPNPTIDNGTYTYKIYDKDKQEVSNGNITSGGTFKLKNGQYIEIQEIPDNVTYTVEETQPDYGVVSYRQGTMQSLPETATKSRQVTGVLSNSNYVKFINTYASLSVSKQVVGANGDKEKQFTIGIVLDDKSVNGKYGDITFANGIANVQLKHGDTKTATGLPATKYTISEQELTPYVAKEETQTGNLEIGKKSEVTFVNFLTKDLKIGKKVVLEDSALKETYTFQVQFEYPDHNSYKESYTYEKYDSKNAKVGEASTIQNNGTFTLQNGEYIVIKGLPDTTQYTVTETSSGSTSKTTYKTGIIDASLDSNETEGKTVKESIKDKNYVEFENAYAALSIEKEVLGHGDKQKEFTFTVTLGDKTVNGTRGGVGFTNGVGTFKLKNGEKKELLGLPATTYTVEESDNEGYTVYKKNSTGTLTAGTTINVKFTNYQTREIRIEKEVSGTAVTGVDDYHFTLTFNNLTNEAYPKTYSYDKYNKDGIIQDSSSTISSGGTIVLKDGEYAIVKGIPDETNYTVEEIDSRASKVTHYHGKASEGLDEETEIEGTKITEDVDNHDYVKVINYYDGLSVRKVVLGSGDKQKAFTFTVTLSDKTVNGTYGQMQFTNGVATFTLKHNERKTATGLPDDVTYTVTESDNEGYQVYKTNDTGSLKTGANITSTFINYKTQNLKIEKEVMGKQNDQTDYTFTLHLTKTNAEIDNGEYDYKKYDKDKKVTTGKIKDKGTFTLKDGEYIVVENVPDDTKYTVEETVSNRQVVGYYQGMDGQESEITMKGSIATGTIYTANYVKFVNTYASISISKSVIGLTGDKSKQFNFVLTLDDDTINETYDGVTFKNGVAEFTLKHGDTKTITGLPEVGYTVTEKTSDGYIIKRNNAKGTLKARETANVQFTNYVSKVLKIEKKVEGEVQNPEKNYTFALKLELPNIGLTINDFTYQKYNSKGEKVGTASTISSNDEFTLKAGEYIIIEDLPDEIKYTIEEKDSRVSKIRYALGTIAKGTDITSEGKTVTGELYSKDYVICTNSYAGIAITKSVIGETGDKEKAFNFTMSLSDKSVTGTYGDLTFTNGVSEFTLKHGQTLKALELPDNIDYEIVETANDYRVVKRNTTGKTVAGTTIPASFINYMTKNLIIEKVVNGEEPIHSTDYSFHITFKHLDNEAYEHSYNYKKYHTNNGTEVLESGILTEDSTFTLKDGEYLVVENLPDEVTYNVKEETSASRTTYYKDSMEEEVTGNEVSGDIVSDSYVRFTNYYAGISISKEVIGKTGDRKRNFEFTMVLSDKTVNGTYGDLTFTNGVSTFALKHGETKKALGLPDGVEYEVTESGVEGYYAEANNQIGKVIAGATEEVTFTNYVIRNLRVEKRGHGVEPEPNKDYRFTILFSNIENPIYPIVYTYQKYNEAGEAIGEMDAIESGESFTLKDGEYIIIYDIPDDINYRIIEEIPEKSGKITVKKTTSGILTDHEIFGEVAYDNTVLFINSYASITVENQVTGDASDPNKEFTFTVTLDDDTINGQYGDMFFTDGVSSFTLKDGESKTATGLPDGVGYTVEETDNEGYTVSKENDKSTTQAGENSLTKFSNNRGRRPNPTLPNTGDDSHPIAWAIISLLSVISLFFGIRLYRKSSAK